MNSARAACARSSSTQKSGTAYNPQANATQARTMEHYRRLGFADEIRAHGPAGRLSHRHRLFHALRDPRARALQPAGLARRAAASFEAWAARGARRNCRIACRRNTSSRCFCRHAREAAGEFASATRWRLADVHRSPERIEARIAEREDGEGRDDPRAPIWSAPTARAAASSPPVRLGYGGEAASSATSWAGACIAVYLRAPDFYKAWPHPTAWMYCRPSTTTAAP